MIIEKPQWWIVCSVFCGQSVVFYMINPKYIWQQTINSLLIHLHGDFSLYIWRVLYGCDKSNFVLTISSDSGIIKVNWHKNVHHYYLLLWKSLPIELFFRYLNSLITNLMWEVIITSYVVFTFCNLQIQNTYIYHRFDSLTWLCPKETDLQGPFWWLTVIFH